MVDKPKVAGDVDAFCSKCGMDLAHTVVAMVGDRVMQARCNTCGAFHRYRKPKKAAAAAGAGRRAAGAGTGGRKKTTGSTRGTAKAQGWTESWERLVEQAGDAPIKRYRPADGFEPNGLIQHAKFGLGVVQKVPEPNKISVLFRTGPRTLVMNR